MINSELIEYNITIISKEKGRVIFELNGHVYNKGTTEFHKVLSSIDLAFEYAYDCLESIIDIYKIGNSVYLKIQTIENIIYGIRLSNYLSSFSHKQNFINNVYNNGHKLLTSYITSTDYVLIDFCCGHGPQSIKPFNYNKSARCSVCSHNKILPYINDCYTLRPDLLRYFINPEDAIGLPIGSQKVMDFICPDCGTIRKNNINNIVSYGFFCKECSDNISYPEKFMQNVLKQLGIDFIYRETPEWSRYVLDGKERKGEYDFIIESNKIIIEMDGQYHYINKFVEFNNQVQIDASKDKIAEQNGYRIIRINCNYPDVNTRFDYIKSSIIEGLSEIFDLSIINWEVIKEKLVFSKMIVACKMWEEDKCLEEISKELILHKATIRRYLRRGNEINLCHFNDDISNFRNLKQKVIKRYTWVKVSNYKSGEMISVFYDMDNFVYNFYNQYGYYMRKETIFANLSGKYSKSIVSNIIILKFEQISEQQYNELSNNKYLISDKLDKNISVISNNKGTFLILDKENYKVYVQ